VSEVRGTRRGRAVAALVLAAAACGCTLAPRHERPPLPTAAEYPADVVPGGGGARAVDLPWQQFFADPRLRALVTRALEHNRDLRAAVLRIDEARAQYRLQRAALLPVVDLRASSSRARTGEGTALGVAPRGPEGVTIEQHSVEIGVAAFELDFWGRVRALSGAARARYLATVHAQRAFRLGLIADVADAYLALRELDERITLAERTVQLRGDALEIARLRLDAGVTSALDSRQTEVLLTQAQTELAALRLQRALTRSTLELLVGGPLPSSLPPPRDLEHQQLAENFAAGLPSDLLVARPDVLQAEEALRAAGADVGVARAAFLPRVDLTALVGYAGGALADLFDGGASTWSARGSAAVPLFAGGANVAGLRAAEARLAIAVAGYERAVQGAFREVVDALAGRRFLADQYEAQRRALVAQRDRAELANLRYRSGVVGFLEVLDAERELFAAEQALVQTRRQRLSNAVALYVALGGGLDRP
jgi:multidrug efflux system outer membrane protein